MHQLKRSLLLIGCLLAPGLVQGLDLDSLYLSAPNRGEANAITNAFHITKTNGQESFQKWSLYEPDAFDPYSTKPSVYPLINSLRAIRAQRFSVPLPIANGDVYAWLSNHFNNGRIELDLDDGLDYAAGNYIHIHTVFWDVRIGSDPFKPQDYFWRQPWLIKAQLLVHETRHLDADAPAHADDSDDHTLAEEGAWGWACIYEMWVWKYGLNFSPLQRFAAQSEAYETLKYRFNVQPPTHPNPAIQALINEVMVRRPGNLKADAGSDSVIVIPFTAVRGIVRLDGSGSLSLTEPIAKYIWSSADAHKYFETTQPDTLISLTPGEYLWDLYIKTPGKVVSRKDTVMVKIIKNVSVVESVGHYPLASGLVGIYPNPFNPNTEISYTISTSGPVVVEIFNLVGHHIHTCVDQWQDAGEHHVRFTSGGLASGVYLCRLRTRDATTVRRMLLMR